VQFIAQALALAKTARQSARFVEFAVQAQPRFAGIGRQAVDLLPLPPFVLNIHRRLPGAPSAPSDPSYRQQAG
jgi:hypothetical protein